MAPSARGLLVGRFQPFHLGHLAVVKEIRSRRPDAPLILGLGSAQESYTRENPFTAGERAEMIERALAAEKISEVRTVPIVDIDRHAVWVAHVTSLLPPFDRVYTNNPLTRLLFGAAGFSVEGTPLAHREEWEGATIRSAMAAGGRWRESVPASVAAYLDEIHGESRMKTLFELAPSERVAGRER